MSTRVKNTSNPTGGKQIMNVLKPNILKEQVEVSKWLRDINQQLHKYAASNETVDYHMTENVTISLTSELVQKIDRLHGSVPRSRFVLDAFQDYLSHNDGNAWNVNL
jgi:hypothetical protein